MTDFFIYLIESTWDADLNIVLIAILIPRAHDPSGLCQESRPLTASNTGSPWFMEVAVVGLIIKSIKSDWLTATAWTLRMLRNWEQPEVSILVQTKRIAASGDKNVF